MGMKREKACVGDAEPSPQTPHMYMYMYIHTKSQTSTFRNPDSLSKEPDKLTDKYMQTKRDYKSLWKHQELAALSTVFELLFISK